tara:strand:- start:4130 stop:5875 length:1746 start_codon:yes stop_codon:yes gene_type:complete
MPTHYGSSGAGHHNNQRVNWKKGDPQRPYYQAGSFGSYQFLSLEDIINQFMISYVGEGKIIPNAKKLDIAFHAHRALQELSFDTLKSFKSQQIDLPPSLTMALPHDYVNYTKLTAVDGAGIKHPLYPTKHTSNPFQIKQHDSGEYYFGELGQLSGATNIVQNSDYSSLGAAWTTSNAGRSSAWSGWDLNNAGIYRIVWVEDIIQVNNNQLQFKHLWNNGFGVTGSSRAYAAWQPLNIANERFVDLRAVAGSAAQQTDAVTGNLLCDFGVIRVGLTTIDPTVGWPNTHTNPQVKSAYASAPGGPNMSPNFNTSNYDVLDQNGNPAYLEWSDGTSSQKEILEIDISQYDQVWVYVQSFAPWTSDAITTLDTYDHDSDPATPNITFPNYGSTVQPTPITSANNTHQVNFIDLVEVVTEGEFDDLTENSTDKNSTTWNNYKSHNPSENDVQDYRDYENHIYWPNEGERYGIDPVHAQTNGSFYIDDRVGRIHFSSNISGKTVILDYISDSLGTDEETMVHKFAEEAMYKSIAYAVVSASAFGQQFVPRFKKERFAAVRQAKLRLSNIKLEEITQILRGKSKHIKH